MEAVKMSRTSQSQKVWRIKSWQIILFFGILLWLIYGIGSFTLDYYAGGATEPFGVFPEMGGIGMFFA